MKRILKLLTLPITLILSSCGIHAPVLNNCAIAPEVLKCSRARPAPKEDPDYDLTPLQADHYLCNSTGDFLVRKIYIITLENNLAKCNKTPVDQPRVMDYVIDGPDKKLFGSDGIASNTLDWADAVHFLCASPVDFDLEKVYRNELIQDIASCTS